MDIDRISAKAAAEKWGVTPRYVQMACKSGAIKGAVQWGRTWMIPSDAAKPMGKRGQSGAEEKPFPRKTLFLDMTDLYHTPGCGQESIEALADHPTARLLFEAELDYARGEIDAVYEKASRLLESCSDFYTVVAAGVLLGFSAMWRGDVAMWSAAKEHIFRAPVTKDTQRDLVSLALVALDSSNYDIEGFPQWFEQGIFESLHPDCFPAVRVFYAKYLYVAGYAVASKQLELKGVQGLSLMSMLPNTIEPMISQAMADRTVIAEIYLRTICAEIYHNCGNRQQAIRHIDRAITLARPDGLLGILVEHRKALDTLLDERIAQVAPELTERFSELYKTFSVGWAKLSGKIRNRKISTDLTPRERQVAKLAAFGLSNAEIAEALHISVSAVKQSIRLAVTKGGVSSRSELIKIL